MSNIFLKRIDESQENISHDTLDSFFNNLVGSDYSPSSYISNMNLRISGEKYKTLRVDSERAIGNRKTHLFYDIFYCNNDEFSYYNGLISFYNVDLQRKTVKLSFLMNADLQSQVTGIIHHILTDAANLLSQIQYIEIEMEFYDKNYDYKLNNLLHKIGFTNAGHDSHLLIMDIESFLKDETPRSSNSSKNNDGNGNTSLGSDVNHPKLVCKYFKLNECKWGTRCRFLHEIPVGNATSPPKDRAKLPDSPPESKSDQSNSNIISKMSTYLLKFLNNASGEWLSYLKYYDVDAKPQSFTFISDGIIKNIQEMRNVQPLIVLNEICNTGIDICRPNSREIAIEKLELLIFWNKELLLHFERQLLDSKYQVEVEKLIKSSNYLFERLNLLFARRSPVAYSISPIAYPLNATTNVPNTYPPHMYATYGDSTTLSSGSASYYAPHLGGNNAQLTGFIPSNNSSYISQLPTAAPITIAFTPTTDTTRYNEKVIGVTADNSDKTKNNDNRREWTGKRYKRKSGKRQYPTENSAPLPSPPLMNGQLLNFSQVLQAAEHSTPKT